ncbi:phosphotransferase [Chlorobium sp. N1]|uniref:aminoglycoside phosphotransferase family protein n=1 Tax=Chlorobium sp. N1 TaxID=2491138 RepID=UPI001039074C|nr:phosphotransferase [Chlorobium sp. N1]TCD48072.1 aminoglycoside phosphotransferase [Chlorobium sp. N1]
MTTEERIRSVLGSSEGAEAAITRIQGDASSRQYFRVAGAGRTLIACHDPAFEGRNPEHYPFLTIHRLFREHSVPVPEIIASDSRLGIILQEDCGSLQLQDALAAAAQEEAAALSRQAVDLMVRIQAIPPSSEAVPFSLSFDMEKLMFEFDFFLEHALLGWFGDRFEEDDAARLRREFLSIARLLVRPERFVLNHRDFHSRNILIHRGRPVVIDFQDARMGLAQYDAASLLRDSYALLPDLLVEELQHRHHDALLGAGLSGERFEDYLHLFDLSAFQRNIKALGTFAFQIRERGKRSFEASIPPTLRYIQEYVRRRPELEKAGRILRPVLEEAEP